MPRKKAEVLCKEVLMLRLRLLGGYLIMYRKRLCLYSMEYIRILT